MQDDLYKKVVPPAASSKLIRFTIVGSIGFLTDTLVLAVLLFIFEANIYLARLVSFLIASAATWSINRVFTFNSNAVRTTDLASEYAKYIVVQIAGAIVNILLFSVIIWQFSIPRKWLIIPLALGAVSGLLVNYLGSKAWIFAKR